MKADMYHYIECGLDDVWLENGFRYRESDRGMTVSISAVDALHEAIGINLCENRRTLTGREIRFLRHEMLMSQSVLALLLDVKELTINRWETGKTSMPRAAEILIRLLYMEKVRNRAGKVMNALKRIGDIEDRIDRMVFVQPVDGSQDWKIAA